MARSTYRILLDARAAFPYSDPSARQSTKAWSETPNVAAALTLLTKEEQTKVLKYYFPKDAALSLASSLLKHYIITRACNVPWAQSVVSQDKSIRNGKPYYAKGGLEFNISHHGAAAVLVATTDPNIKVGIDLTQVDVLKDVPKVQKAGFAEWIGIFESVFSPQEARSMLQAGPSSSSDAAAVINGLRTFYSYWALKEAYFKMTGDALLADWLQELSFSNVRPPVAAQACNGLWIAGEKTLATASLRGQTIGDVQLELLALGEHYIVATSTTTPCELAPFEEVGVWKDIMPLAS